MRLAALTISALALAGCQGFGPAPDVSALPHATVKGTHVDVTSDRTDTFRVLEIDGHDALPAVDQPVKLIGHDAASLVAAGRPVRVKVEGLAYYYSVRRLFWDPMHVEGVVEFVPAAGARYVVNGAVSPELSSIWIEDAATHEVVGRKISAPGRSASAPAQ